jgi:signal transduction histidine kinase
MNLTRFRRSHSWLEDYATDLGVAAFLLVLIVATTSVSGWISSRMPARAALADLADGWRIGMLGCLIAVSIVFAVRPLLPAGGALRWAGLAVLVLAAASIGYAPMPAWVEANCNCRWPPDLYWEIAYRHEFFVITAIVAGFHEFMSRTRRAAEALHTEQLERAALDGELAAGRMQVLLAQIEPHFLFNSLANLRRLLKVDAEAGQAMLGDLLRYLEVALPRMRADQSTLEREAELVRAFLAVHQVRMGERLTVDVEVPPDLGSRAMPPMMLLTLVENALKHGVGPLPEGGAIRVAASESDGRLTVSVADTGRGIVPGSGGGTGLANIRGRLRAGYGNAASLTLRLNQPRGVVATIELPEPAR